MCEIGEMMENGVGRFYSVCEDRKWSICKKCGELRESCCPSEKRCKAIFGKDELVCLNDTCIKCGSTGEPCCENEACKHRFPGFRECVDGICVNCGYDEEPCCKTKEKCHDFLSFHYRCINDTCIKCGSTGEPCCEGEEKCFGTIPSLVCINDICKECGGLKEPCCKGEDCASWLKCIDGICVEE